jgi:mRNA interferase MazF
MPTFSRGDVVLTRFPFTDLAGASVRPALVVSDGAVGQDLVLTAISSVVRGSLPPTDLLIDTTHPEFSATGLRVASVIRLHRLVTVEQSVVVRRLGKIGAIVQQDVDQRLRQLLRL